MQEFIGLDQFLFGENDGVQRPVQLFLPKTQEICEDGKFWRDIIILPDIGLQEVRPIRHVIDNLCRGQVIPLHQSYP